MNDTEVIVKNSLIIKGQWKLIHEDCTEEIISGKRSLFRCGLSSAMPFCDQTHRSKMKWVKLTEKDENGY